MTLMQNNGKLTQKKNQSGVTANGSQIGVITVLQLFPLAWEANGRISCPVGFHYKLSNGSGFPAIHLFPLSLTVFPFPSFLQDLVCLLSSRDHWFIKITTATLD